MDNNISDCIEYDYIAIVTNPYYRAVSIYQNGCKLRKNKLKSQNFIEYFENNLNKWDFLEDDKHESQKSYFLSENTTIFNYEKMLDDWSEFNNYINSLGLNSIRYYIDSDKIKKWEEHYDDKIAIELGQLYF